MPATFSLSLAILFASIFALSPLAIDMYLPTIPALAQVFDASIQDVAVSISIYIIGLAIGQFIGGPISDSWGRLPILLTGLGIFFIASLGLANADTLHTFWWLRFVQAIGGGFAAVVVPAVIRDHTEGQATAKLLTFISMMTIIAPAIAPALGTLAFKLSGWRSVFYILAAYSAVVAMGIWRKFPVTVTRSQNEDTGSVFSRYRQVFIHPLAPRYLLAQGLNFGVMMTFLVNSSLVYIDHYGLNETTFSALFAANVLFLMFGNRLNSYLLNRLPAALIVHRAIALQSFACLGLLVATYFEPPLYVVVPWIALSYISLGGVMGNSPACYMQFFPVGAGTAASLLGSGQYLLSAVVSAISTQFHSDSLWPMSATMTAAALLAMVLVPRPERYAEQLRAEGRGDAVFGTGTS